MNLENKNLNEVLSWLRDNNKIFRIVSRDGSTHLLTQDYKPERYNLSIEKDKVTKITFG